MAGAGAGRLVVPGAARDGTVAQPSEGGVGPGAGNAGTSEGTVAGGAPCFVMPIPVCSTFRSAAPSFSPQPGLQHTWNPELQPNLPSRSPHEATHLARNAATATPRAPKPIVSTILGGREIPGSGERRRLGW